MNLVVGVGFLLFLLLSAPAHADPNPASLLVSPTRVVFERGETTAQLGVSNTGETPATFRVEVVNKRMTRDGRFEVIPESETAPFSVAPYLVYSPRMIRLQPGESQVVRLQLRGQHHLDAGEYRSHLLFRRLPENGIEPEHSEQFSVSLEMAIGVSIPVILRQGALPPADIYLSHYRFLSQAGVPNVLEFEILRRGKRSLFGDLSVSLVTDGKTVKIAEYQGVAVYVPNQERRVRVAFHDLDRRVLSGALVEIRFSDRGPGGKSARSLIRLPEG